MSTKLNQVNEIIKKLGVRNWSVQNEAEAIELVNDVCEGEFDTTIQWEAALGMFETYFAAYVKDSDEFAAEYRRMYE